ncbi:MAG: ankyrin repeat domain-containing protein [Mycobacterium sp.]|nr:ankyrin repeat domain-containing protein [Mycobacterium sp.]
MTTFWELRGNAVVWPGVISRSLMVESQIQAGGYLADMAAKGNWSRVIQDLDPDNHLVDVNQWRPGDTSWTTVLHEAARQGAPLEVVTWLVDRGALRSQRDSENRTAYEVAEYQGQPPELLDLLAPPPSPLSPELIEILDSRMAEVMDQFVQPAYEGQDLRRVFRYPPVGVLHEVRGNELWLQLPPASGGLRVTLQRGYIDVLFGYRSFMPDGAVEVRTWGYVLTQGGRSRVYEGFVSTPGEPSADEDADEVLEWRQVRNWWQASRIRPKARKQVGDARTFRIYPNGTSYELWAWPGPEQAREWPRRLSQHLVLDEAKGAANVHMADVSALS